MSCDKINDCENEIDEWKRFVNGDLSYYENIFRKYYKEMYGYGLKLSQREEIVKDCIQELFQTIWERRKKLQHIKSPRVYLFVSLRRNILKKLKKRKKRKDAFKKIEESCFIEFGIEEIIIKDEIKKQQKEALHKALNHLSDRQREIIYLHFYNGMSYGEIEKILSINRQSVRNHVYRAMETLRSLFPTEMLKWVITLLISFLFIL